MKNNLEVRLIWRWEQNQYLNDGWTINYCSWVSSNIFSWLLAKVMDIRPYAVRSIKR